MDRDSLMEIINGAHDNRIGAHLIIIYMIYIYGIYIYICMYLYINHLYILLNRNRCLQRGVINIRVGTHSFATPQCRQTNSCTSIGTETCIERRDAVIVAHPLRQIPP